MFKKIDQRKSNKIKWKINRRNSSSTSMLRRIKWHRQMRAKGKECRTIWNRRVKDRIKKISQNKSTVTSQRLTSKDSHPPIRIISTIHPTIISIQTVKEILSISIIRTLKPFIFPWIRINLSYLKTVDPTLTPPTLKKTIKLLATTLITAAAITITRVKRMFLNNRLHHITKAMVIAVV